MTPEEDHNIKHHSFPFQKIHPQLTPDSCYVAAVVMVPNAGGYRPYVINKQQYWNHRINQKQARAFCGLKTI